MRITKIAKVDREITTDIICNKCGESCKEELLDETMQMCSFYGLIEVTVTGGYCSTHLADGSSYTFSLCEKCLVELFESFKIKESYDEGF